MILHLLCLCLIFSCCHFLQSEAHNSHIIVLSQQLVVWTSYIISWRRCFSHLGGNGRAGSWISMGPARPVREGTLKKKDLGRGTLQKDVLLPQVMESCRIMETPRSRKAGSLKSSQPKRMFGGGVSSHCQRGGWEGLSVPFPRMSHRQWSNREWAGRAHPLKHPLHLQSPANHKSRGKGAHWGRLPWPTWGTEQGGKLVWRYGKDGEIKDI